MLYGRLRKHLGEVFHKLSGQKESRIEEGHLVSDHVHMLISIPPKYAVSQVLGSSRVRAQPTWCESTGSGSRMMPARTSGRAAISFPR